MRFIFNPHSYRPADNPINESINEFFQELMVDEVPELRQTYPFAASRNGRWTRKYFI